MKWTHWKLGTVLMGVLILLCLVWWPETETPEPLQPATTPNDAFVTSSPSSSRLHPRNRSAPMRAIDDCLSCPSEKREAPVLDEDVWHECYAVMREAAINGDPFPDVSHLGDCEKNTPLHQVRNAEQVRRLVQAGADPNARDDIGLTPLHNAAILRINPEIVEALLEAGADPNVTDKWGQTPLNHLQSTPTPGEIIFKMKDFIKTWVAEEDVDLEALYKRDPSLRPEAMALSDLDRKHIVERMLLRAMGLEIPEDMLPEDM